MVTIGWTYSSDGEHVQWVQTFGGGTPLGNLSSGQYRYFILGSEMIDDIYLLVLI
jgi:hypothetical protein